MGRDRVYEVIDSERAYQIYRWGADHDRREPVTSFLVYMQDYLTIALHQATHDEKTALMDTIRKITALGVACMEQNDTTRRTGF